MGYLTGLSILVKILTPDLEQPLYDVMYTQLQLIWQYVSDGRMLSRARDARTYTYVRHTCVQIYFPYAL